MITRLGLALLNGVITYIILLIIATILGMVGAGAIGAIISQFALVVALLVGILTFLGAIPNYWNGIVR